MPASRSSSRCRMAATSTSPLSPPPSRPAATRSRARNSPPGLPIRRATWTITDGLRFARTAEIPGEELLHLDRVETVRAFAALVGDAALRRDHIEALGPCLVGLIGGVIEAVN